MKAFKIQTLAAKVWAWVTFSKHTHRKAAIQTATTYSEITDQSPRATRSTVGELGEESVKSGYPIWL